MNHLLLLFILNGWGIAILAISALVVLFTARAIIKHNKEEAKEKSDINNITTWKEWDEWNQMPTAKKHPDLMQTVKKRIVETDLVAISTMKLPDMLSLSERAISFPALQFKIKQKIKEFIEKEYKFLEERRQNKSSDTADYLKDLAQHAVRVGATGLAIDLSKLEGYYRPNKVLMEALETTG